ncbi:MAG: CsiV family protein [Woeseiaceae bacterium]
MRRLITIPVMTLLSALLSAVAMGQEFPADETPEVRRYTVEVIIFRYAEDVSIGTELFLPDAPVVEELSPESELVYGDLEPEPEAADIATVEEDGSEVFILHIEDDFSMADIASHLERLDAYEPMMHFAWTQPTHSQEDTSPIDLASLGEAPEGLTGSFALYLSRYLHLVVDLTLDAEVIQDDPVAIDDSVLAFSDERTGFGYQDPAPVRFRIADNRIFKSGDLRYFDHPKFGVLAKTTRVEEEEPEVEPELLGDDPGELLGGIDQ